MIVGLAKKSRSSQNSYGRRREPCVVGMDPGDILGARGGSRLAQNAVSGTSLLGNLLEQASRDEVTARYSPPTRLLSLLPA